jgi:hypothetical protein
MVGRLHGELRAYLYGRDSRLGDLMFPTATGGRQDKDNLNKRIVAPVVKRTNQMLRQRGVLPSFGKSPRTHSGAPS